MKAVMIGGPPRLFDYAQMTTEAIFVQTNNTGNLAFRYAVYKHLGRNVKVLAWGAAPEKVHRAGEIAVIPCANQLGPHADCKGRADLVSQLDIPVLAIGLGAQSPSKDEFPEIQEDTARWVHAMAERRAAGVANITVRGEFTRRVLERMGLKDGVEVLGCPSLFISNDEHLGRTIAERLDRPTSRVAVAAGNPAKPEIAALERRLLATAKQSGGSYIVQHPLPFIKAARGEFSELNQAWQKRLGALLGRTGAQAGAASVPSNMTVFFDVDAWMEDLRRHDLVVGMRIHGTMLAIQAGVPALCITHDSRTEELCQTMCVPHVPADRLPEGKLDVATLLKHMEFDPQQFDTNRRKLARKYRDILHGSGLQVPRELDRLAGLGQGSESVK